MFQALQRSCSSCTRVPPRLPRQHRHHAQPRDSLSGLTCRSSTTCKQLVHPHLVFCSSSTARFAVDGSSSVASSVRGVVTPKQTRHTGGITCMVHRMIYLTEPTYHRNCCPEQKSVSDTISNWPHPGHTKLTRYPSCSCLASTRV
jgi:hypothetical protein